MLHRRVRIIRWTAPLWTVILAAFVFAGALAWAAIVYLSSVSVATTGQPQDWNLTGSAWQCNLVGGGTAVVSSCVASPSGGVVAAVTGVSDPAMQLELERDFTNITASQKCIGIIGSPTLPAGWTLERMSPTNGIVAAGAQARFNMRLTAAGMTPSTNYDIPEITVGSVACP